MYICRLVYTYITSTIDLLKHIKLFNTIIKLYEINFISVKAYLLIYIYSKFIYVFSLTKQEETGFYMIYYVIHKLQRILLDINIFFY